MWWEKFTTWLDSFTQNPTVVAIFSVLSTFVGVFAVFSKTSYGKRAINKAISIGHRTEESVKQIARTVEDFKKETVDEIIDFKETVERKVSVIVSVVDFYEQSLFDILGEIPNAKVQNKVAQFRESYDAKKKIIEQEIGTIYSDYQLAVSQKAEEIEQEYAKKYQEIYGELENLKLQIAPYQEKLEEEVANGEENENTDSEEKGI